MLKISVIIPTFKPGTYIKDCLQSVFNQTLNPISYEIIVILNGPKAPFYEKLKKYDNIHLYFSDIPSVSNARNIGIENAKGEYICFIDDDDIISPTYLEKLLEKANENTLVISNVYSFLNNTTEKRENFFICKHLRKKDKIGSNFFKNRSYLAFPVAKIIHRNIIGNRRFDLRFKNGEDALFITSISNKIKNIRYSDDDAIYYVRERVGSATRKKIPLKKLAFDSFKLICAYFRTYMTSPFTYNLPLFISRIPGVLKNAYLLSKNK